MTSKASAVFGLVLDFEGEKLSIGPTSLEGVKENGLEVVWPAEGDTTFKPVPIVTANAIAGLLQKLRDWSGDSSLQLNFDGLPEPLASIEKKLSSIEVDLIRIHVKVPPSSYLVLESKTDVPAAGTQYTYTDGSKRTVVATTEKVSTGDGLKLFAKMKLDPGVEIQAGQAVTFKDPTDKTLQGVWTGGLLYTFAVQVAQAAPPQPSDPNKPAAPSDLFSLGGLGVQTIILGVTNEPPTTA